MTISSFLGGQVQLEVGFYHHRLEVLLLNDTDDSDGISCDVLAFVRPGKQVRLTTAEGGDIWFFLSLFS